MNLSKINVSFPCPRCGMGLNIPNFTALGPCPSCQTQIKMELNITVASVEDLQAAQPEPQRKQRYWERALKANTPDGNAVAQKPHHPPKDWR